MDELTTVVALVPHPSQDDAERWFVAVVGAYDEARDVEDVWQKFCEVLPGTAAEHLFTDEQARTFIDGVETMTSDGAALLRLMEDNRDQLGAYYASAYAGDVDGASTQESDGGDRFAWVYDGRLPDELLQAFQFRPEHYQSHLGPYLDQTWGLGWEAHPAEHKQAWLRDLLQSYRPAGEQEVPDTRTDVEQPQPATTDDETVTSAQELAAEALAEALAEVPEAADLPLEVVQRVLAEALSDTTATARH